MMFGGLRRVALAARPRRFSTATDQLNAQGYVLLKSVLPPSSLAQGVPPSFEESAQKTWEGAGFDYGIGDYEGGSVERATVQTGSEKQTQVYDVAAGSPAHQVVQPHAENAYLQKMPHFAAFGCLRPADEGGAMTLTDLVAAQNLLSESLRNKLFNLGVTYIRRMGDDKESPNWPFSTKTWQKRFGTESWEDAQQQVLQDEFYGQKAELAWEADTKTAALRWTVAGTARRPLATGGLGEAIVATSILGHHELNDIVGDASYTGGEKPWPAPKHCTWGNGTEITAEELKQMDGAYEDPSITKHVLLGAGDVVVVDNFRWAHGRVPYNGKREHVALFSVKVNRGVDAE
mmetsp:Transcript_72246/g.127691  ORF Transcript_72246/g.127691 Transcript_72246/m.127691 type:complete len:346 (+) Transcript_72246:69-1106(+)